MNRAFSRRAILYNAASLIAALGVILFSGPARAQTTLRFHDIRDLRARAVPDMTVQVESGIAYPSGVQVSWAGGNSGAFTAPGGTDKRIDVVTLTPAGALHITQGTPGAAPTQPALPAGEFPICSVYLKSTSTSIVAYDDSNTAHGYILADLRGLGYGSDAPNGLTASRLVATDSGKHLASVPTLSSWLAGTSNRVSITDDGDGTATFTTPQDTHTGASPTFVNETLSGRTAGRVAWYDTGGAFNDAAGLAWDGSYFTASSIKDSALTAGRVPYVGSSKQFADDSALSYDLSYLTVPSLKDTALTAGRVPYVGSAKELADTSRMTWDGSTFWLSGPGTTGGVLQAIRETDTQGAYSSTAFVHKSSLAAAVGLGAATTWAVQASDLAESYLFRAKATITQLSPLQAAFSIERDPLGTPATLLTVDWAGNVDIAGTFQDADIPTTIVRTSRTISTTSPLSGGGDLSADRTLTIANAAADGSTKGAAAFTASDFNATSGLVSIDYTNGQAASAAAKGFLTAADWSTFNAKQGALTTGNLTATLPVSVSGSRQVIGGAADISIADFVGSGLGHARGAVPDPGAVAGTTKYLREDGGWQVPPAVGGGGAPIGAQYLVLAADSDLTTERVITPGTSLTVTDDGAGGHYHIDAIQDIRTTVGPTWDHLHATGGYWMDAGATQGLDVSSGNLRLRYDASNFQDNRSNVIYWKLNGVWSYGLGTASFFPYTDSTFGLGDSNHYWSGIYGDRYYANSTAYIDGASAGVLNLYGTTKINNAYTLPAADGAVGQYQTTNGAGVVGWATPPTGGFGNVTAGAAIADHALVRGDGGAYGVQSSQILVGDTGLFSTYGNVATQGYGVPAIVDYDTYTARATSIAATNLAGTTTAGLYLVWWYAVCTVTEQGPPPPSLTVTLSYTDDSGANTAPTAGSQFFGVVGNKSSFNGLTVQHTAPAGAAIQYSTTSGAVGTGRYTFYIQAVRIG